MIDETIRTQPKLKTTADYKAAIAALIAKMDTMFGQMEKDRPEIERLRAESRVLSAQNDAMLDGLEKQLNALRMRARTNVKTVA